MKTMALLAAIKTIPLMTTMKKTIVLLAALLMSVPSAALAGSSSVLRGRVLGVDGRPMRSAFGRPMGGPDRLLAAEANGSFSIAFPRPGGHYVWFGGVHHQTVLV